MTAEEKTEEKSRPAKPKNNPLFIGAGIAIGAGVGIGMGNIAVGVGVGLALGVAMSHTYAK